MSTHFLKVWPAYFERLKDGSKRFEVRKNDRDFQTGDYLVLDEWDPESEAHTGRCVTKRVSYTLYGPGHGIADGYVVMSLEAER
jgi:hypothetical protein